MPTEMLNLYIPFTSIASMELARLGKMAQTKMKRNLATSNAGRHDAPVNTSEIRGKSPMVPTKRQ